MSILFEPAIAHFGKAKHSLDDPDRMLDFGPHPRHASLANAIEWGDNRAGRNFQPLRSQMPLHLVEQPPTQIVLFEQVTEAAHRSLIRHWLAAKSLPSRRRGSMPTNRRIAGES